jgi:GNAT superfamily N-acetyltransferase
LFDRSVFPSGERAAVVVRPANTADAEAAAALYVQSWRDTYLGIIPPDYLYTMSVSDLAREFEQELADRHVFGFVAERRGRLEGFVTGGAERSGDSIYAGEIYALYVRKTCQRRGIGTRLIVALASEFLRRDFHSLLVWVLMENPCRRFYEKRNGIFLRSRRAPFAGVLLDLTAYSWIHAGLLRM